MCFISEKSHAEKYFYDVLNKLGQKRVKAVFSLCTFIRSHSNGAVVFKTDGDVYILFENDMCLILDYLIIDRLEVRLRELSKEEKTAYQKNGCVDLFNISGCTALEYGYLKQIEPIGFTGQYSKWVDGELEYTDSTSENFNDIRFVMDNGNSFVISAEDGDGDGYTAVSSRDVREGYM